MQSSSRLQNEGGKQDVVWQCLLITCANATVMRNVKAVTKDLTDMGTFTQRANT